MEVKSTLSSFLKYVWEKLSVYITGANEFKNKLKEHIEKEGLHPGQVYNMNETGLNVELKNFSYC